MKSKFEEIMEAFPATQDRSDFMAVELAETYLANAKLKTENECRIVFWRGDFYIFDRTHYKKQSSADFQASVVSWMQKSTEFRKYSKKNHVANVILNIEALTKISDEVEPSTLLFEEPLHAPASINLKNGIFNVGLYLSGEPSHLVPHSPLFFSTICLPYPFISGASCPIWISFIQKALPDEPVRNLVQEWFGYNLIFDSTLEKFVIFVGEGANGKTVCCVVLRSLLGEENVSAVGLESFSATRTFPIAATVGKLANVVEELSEIDKAAEGELKKFVSGALMTIERKHKNPFEVRASARLTFCTNVLPKFSDRSDGIWRRLLLIPFTNQIKNEAEQDKRLIDPKFWEQSGELPGIFNWALEGLIRLKSRSYFEEPAICREAKASFKKDVNPAKSFLIDFCEAIPGAVILSRTIYEHYTEYTKNNGHHPLSEPTFSKEIARVFPTAEKSKNAVYRFGKRGHVWYHIQLKPSTDTVSTDPLICSSHK